jgi:hypothetical protein
MVTFLDLRDSLPDRLGSAADEWKRMAEKLKMLETRVVNELIKPIRDSRWTGDPADIAYRTFDRLDDEFELTARQVRNVSTVLRFAREKFVEVQRKLQDTIGEVNRDGLRIDEQRGTVRDPDNYVSMTGQPGGAERYQQLLERARAYTRRLQLILNEADRLDGEVARVLTGFRPYSMGRMDSREWHEAVFSARSALSLVGAPETPKPEWSPQENRAWWDRLTEDQRSLYLAAHPDRVGALDGLPAQVRHDANLTVLRDRIDQHPPSEGPTGRLTSLLDRLERSEYGSPADRLYLLGINNTGDGLGIVSVGNPDTARHLGVAVVPGITVTLDHMNDEIDRATALRQTADALTPGQGDVAMIAWLGYDTPGIPDAPLHGAADTAAPRLDRFVDGTRVAQLGEGNTTSHRTIIGHSYGSAVVGIAASQGNGLDVQDIIVAGSPGMHVATAAELNIDPRHVWTGRGDYDYVPWIGPPSHGAPSVWPPSLGTAPHSPEFGGNRFIVDTTGHTAYWTPNSQSLINQSRIIVGQYNEVGLVHGRPPQQ